MIAYVDSSVLARAYLMDEVGHHDAAHLLEDAEMAVVTGTRTRIEVSGALVRAARAGRGDGDRLLAALDADLGPGGPVTMLEAPQHDIETRALELVREHALRAMDAWHLAVAAIALPQLVEAGEAAGFASRDAEQARVAGQLGLVAV